MIKKILLLMLMGMSFFNVAFSASKTSFNEVEARLSKITRLTGHYQQIRNIKLLSVPIKSEGVFTFSKKNGLALKQTAPFQSTLTITGSRLTQQIGNDSVTVINKKQMPIVFLFTKIFLSALRGNVTALGPYFKVHFSGNTDHWTMLLVAKKPPMNKAIKSIQLVGGRYVNSVVIDEATGDQQTIAFSQMRS